DARAQVIDERMTLHPRRIAHESREDRKRSARSERLGRRGPDRRLRIALAQARDGLLAQPALAQARHARDDHGTGNGLLRDLRVRAEQRAHLGLTPDEACDAAEHGARYVGLVLLSGERSVANDEARRKE